MKKSHERGGRENEVLMDYFQHIHVRMEHDHQSRERKQATKKLLETFFNLTSHKSIASIVSG